MTRPLSPLVLKATGLNYMYTVAHWGLWPCKQFTVHSFVRTRILTHSKWLQSVSVRCINESGHTWADRCSFRTKGELSFAHVIILRHTAETEKNKTEQGFVSVAKDDWTAEELTASNYQQTVWGNGRRATCCWPQVCVRSPGPAPHTGTYSHSRALVLKISVFRGSRERFLWRSLNSFPLTSLWVFIVL